jgi:hypothetical protein
MDIKAVLNFATNSMSKIILLFKYFLFYPLTNVKKGCIEM